MKNNTIKQCEKGYILIYIISACIGLLTLLIFFLFSHGELISEFFFHDGADTAMDFFHSIEYVNGRAPYDLFDTLYPPLANLLFYFILHCIPMSVSENWPLDFSESVSMRQSQFDLRVYQAPMIIFLIFIVVCIAFIIFIIDDTLTKNNICYKKGLIFAIILSYGMLMTIERGNILILALPLTMFFVYNYDSENRYVRELSYISLAFAAGLKLYPAFLGVLLIRKREWWASIRTIIYGVLSVVLPALFFDEGIGGIVKWINIVLGFNSTIEQPWIGNGLNNLLYDISRCLKMVNIELSDSFFNVIIYIIVAFLLIGSVFAKKEWKSILMIVLSIVFFQSQGEYVFSFFVIPFLCFVIEEDKIQKESVIPYICMMLLILPLPLFYNFGVFYPRNILVHMLYIILILWITRENIILIKDKLKNRRMNNNE